MGMFTNVYNNAKDKMVTRPVPSGGSVKPPRKPAAVSAAEKTAKPVKPAVVEYVNSEEYEKKIEEYNTILEDYRSNLSQYEKKLDEYTSRLQGISDVIPGQSNIDDSFIIQREENLTKIENDLISTINDLKSNQGKQMLEQMQLLIARIDEQRHREEEALMAAEMEEAATEFQGPSELDLLQEVREKSEKLLDKQEDVIKRLVFVENNLITAVTKTTSENRSAFVTQIAELANHVKRSTRGLKIALVFSVIFNILSVGGIAYLVLCMLEII